MKDEERDDLNCWIAENLFGYEKIRRLDLSFSQALVGSIGGVQMDIPNYTTDPAASDALDDAILKNLEWGYEIMPQSDGRVFMADSRFGGIGCVYGENKMICRALFAKKLFSK